MKLLRTVLFLAVAGLFVTTAAFADLQEIAFNVNGTFFDQTFAVPGLNSAGFNSVTGLGTLTLTFNPGAAGLFFFDVFFDESTGNVNGPFFNEFGKVNGLPAVGQSFQIGASFTDGNFNQTIFNNVQGGVHPLPDTNQTPGNKSNFLNNCGGNGGGLPDPTCNTDVATAMAFDFALLATESAVITLNVSQVNPGGFNLQQTHPADPDNANPSSIFFSGDIVIQPAGGPVVPEPGAIVLLGTVLLGLSIGLRRKFLVR